MNMLNKVLGSLIVLAFGLWLFTYLDWRHFLYWIWTGNCPDRELYKRWIKEW
jgi:hypothetical protein